MILKYLGFFLTLRMAHPYSTPQKLTLKCVRTRLFEKACSFVRRGFKIAISTQHTSTIWALTDGNRAILHKKNFILKNCTLSDRHGRLYLLVGRSTLKFRTGPLNISEDAERAAVDAIHPPSYSATGEEEDLFSRSGYLSLQGKVEKVSDLYLSIYLSIIILTWLVILSKPDLMLSLQLHIFSSTRSLFKNIRLL